MPFDTDNMDDAFAQFKRKFEAEMVSAQAKIETLEGDKIRLMNQIDSLGEEHQKIIDSLEEEHQKVIDSLEEEHQKEVDWFGAEIETIEADKTRLKSQIRNSTTIGTFFYNKEVDSLRKEIQALEADKKIQQNSITIITKFAFVLSVLCFFKFQAAYESAISWASRTQWIIGKNIMRIIEQTIASLFDFPIFVFHVCFFCAVVELCEWKTNWGPHAFIRKYSGLLVRFGRKYVRAIVELGIMPSRGTAWSTGDLIGNYSESTGQFVGKYAHGRGGLHRNYAVTLWTACFVCGALPSLVALLWHGSYGVTFYALLFFFGISFKFFVDEEEKHIEPFWPNVEEFRRFLAEAGWG